MLPSKNTITSSSIAAQAISISVGGMQCANCVHTVEAKLLQQTGVILATVNLETGIAMVQCTAEVDSTELVKHLVDAGFPSQLLHSVPTTNAQVSSSPHWLLIGFFVLVVCFNLCLNAQVVTVGLAYFYDSKWWNVHVWLVRGYGGLSLILLAWAYLSIVPYRIRSLTATMPALLGLQFLTIHLKSLIPLAVIHPLIGFTLFSVSTTLVHRVSRFLFTETDKSL